MPARRRRLTLPGWARTSLLLLAAALAALGIRSFLVAPRLVPSESMLPALMPGDLIAVAKWPYGWSRYSLPLELPLWRGRIGAATPRRGELVIFRPDAGPDRVKRVIGLPGERIAVRGGVPEIDGRLVPRFRIADLLVPVTPNNPCRGRQEPAGCRYRRFTEVLPGGRSYSVLDLGANAADDAAVIEVPADALFVLGDNRDRSDDSRAIGPVPLDRVIGRPLAILWSSDGGYAPRRDRIGLVPQ